MDGERSPGVDFSVAVQMLQLLIGHSWALCPWQFITGKVPGGFAITLPTFASSPPINTITHAQRSPVHLAVHHLALVPVSCPLLPPSGCPPSLLLSLLHHLLAPLLVQTWN